jgi:hypothetical protein
MQHEWMIAINYQFEIANWCILRTIPADPGKARGDHLP